jgi:triosephosphate isomerase|tara:strand:- start:78 stop:824 length:747 start_codon:yes stop_codon:yes gene_type:complete
MRKRIVAANWKMNLTSRDALTLVKVLDNSIESKKVTVVLIPSFTLLPAVSAVLPARFFLGAQNVHFELKGAFTGEVNVSQLQDVGCSYVILGHSERRHVFGESDEMINMKVTAALSGGLIPILCVGETADERNAGKVDAVLKAQLVAGLKSITKAQMKKVVIAYEPVWAIGTGKTASPSQADDAHASIRKIVSSLYDKGVADSVSILYGGSVKAANCKELFDQKNIDGALIGGASLDAEQFSSIVADA